jgi:hypothetical protein
MPVSMSREMDSPELRLILAHELAHVRRRDHLVRWLEWLACVGFWWNPVAWWARRNLRTNEEVCCDALVLSSVKPDPHKYATTLLHAAEYLAYPTLRPPAMASGIASGGSLQRRFTLILSGNSLRRAHPVARAFASLCAVSLLSLGIVYAQDASSPKTARQRTVAETNDPSVKALRDLVASGALSVEGARQAHATTTPPEWVVLRYAAGAEGIDASVAAGTLSVEDAAVRKEEMGRTLRSLAFSLDVLAMSIDEAHIAVAVEAGELTREEAAERTAERERYARIHVYFERIGLTQEQSERVLGTLRRLAPEDLRERFPVFLRELGLSADQVEQVVGVARRLAHSRNASTGTPDWVGRVLDERGFEREQSGQVVRALERIVKELQREGELFELNPRMENYLRQTVRLTDEEIELVVGIARRLSAR